METIIWLVIVIAVAIAVSAAALYHQRIIDARDVPRPELEERSARHSFDPEATVDDKFLATLARLAITAWSSMPTASSTTCRVDMEEVARPLRILRTVHLKKRRPSP